MISLQNFLHVRILYKIILSQIHGNQDRCNILDINQDDEEDISLFGSNWHAIKQRKLSAGKFVVIAATIHRVYVRENACTVISNYRDALTRYVADTNVR